MKDYSHSGDLGDIIYSLAAIKAAGGGNLYLYPAKDTREPMTRARFDVIASLLKSQNYIGEVGYVPNVVKGSFDLGLIRNYLRYGQTILEGFFEMVKLPVTCDPWLKVKPIEIMPVIFAKSVRYHNPLFDWPGIVKKYANCAGFIGLKSEYDTFINTYDTNICRIDTQDLFAAASVIAGSKLFIANQSCPAAIGHALGVNMILEVCSGPADNCRINNPKAQYTLTLPEIV